MCKIASAISGKGVYILPEPIAITTTVQDQAGKTSTVTEFVASGLTIAQIEEGAQLHAPKIGNIIGGIISRMEFCVALDISGLTGNTPAGTSDVEEVGEFVFVTAQGRDVVVNVPAINTTTSPAGSNDLDQTDPNISAFIDQMVTGVDGGSGVFGASDVDGNDLTAVKFARERVRNSGSRG